ncbi:immunoglobulin-like domain-containing protein [Paenibacillus ginsengarvi]|nr:immunoglobulin-like domain-containing protein [Paenibacillus ginsengarvi]
MMVLSFCVPFHQASATPFTDALPPTITGQPQGATVTAGDVVILTVTATGSGTLSYQWYRNDVDSNMGGVGLNATGPSFTVPTPAGLDSYYYVVVTNTDPSATVNKTAIERSNTAHVVVNALPSAPAPTAVLPPMTAVNQGTPVTLEVTATGSGILSYQWYRNDVDSNMGGVELTPQKSASYTVPTSFGRDDYFYVVVTNTVPNAQPTSVRSNTAHVVVTALTAAETPSILSQPQEPAAPVPENTPLVLSVDASVTDGGTLSYQWIRNTTNSLSGGAFVVGATDKNFTVRTQTADEGYYFAWITNDNEAAPGDKVARIYSDIVHVVVEDITSPTVEISSLVPSATNRSSFDITIIFSESVTGFTASGITVTNGTLSNFQQSNDRMFTATVSAVAEGDIVLQIGADAALDKASHGNLASPEFRVAYDATSPTVAVSSTETSSTKQSPFDVTVSFSEAVTGFSAGSLNVTNGSVNSVYTLDNKSYTVNVTPLADGVVTVSVRLGAVADAAGNRSLASAPFTVTYDGTPPAVTLTSAKTSPTKERTIPVTIQFNEPVRNFGLSGISVINGSAGNLQTVTGSTYQADITAATDGVVTVSVYGGTAFDAAGNGNTAAVPYSITYDGTAPVVTLLGVSTVRVKIGDPYVEAGATATDNIDGTITAITILGDVVNAAKSGIYVVTYTAADTAGNAGSVSRTVEVYDGDNPVITLIGDAEMQHEAGTAFTDPGVTVTDNYDSDLAGELTVTGSVYTNQLGDYVLKYNVRDRGGNAAVERVRIVHVVDTTKPVVAVIGDNPLLIPVGSPFVDPGARATDSFEGDISNRITVTGSVYTGILGSHTLTYRAADSSGNQGTASRTVVVYDNMHPVIALAGEANMTHEAGTIFIDPGFTAWDAQDGDLTNKVTVTGAVYKDRLGTYALVYNVQDAGGNFAAPVTRIVNVVDTTSPDLTLLGANPYQIARGKAYAEPGATARDRLEGDLSAAIVIKGAVDTNIPGLYTLTYEVSDSSGNKASLKRTVQVYSNEGGGGPTDPETDTDTDTPSEPVTEEQPPKPAVTGVDILVNGKVEKVGKETTGVVNGQQVTTVALDEVKLQQALEAAGTGAVITINVSNDSDIVIGEVSGRLASLMEKRQAVLVVQSGKAAYTLPAELLHMDAIAGQFGTNARLQDIRIHIEIAEPRPETVRLVEDGARRDGLVLVLPPLTFKVTAVYGDRTVEVTNFDAYVERTIAIPAGIDPKRITTGVVLEPDGTMRHVPTKIVEVGGSSYVKINSLTNSTYAVVWHPLEFKDMAGHWAKDAVNDMGSRMIVEGTGDGQFSPDRDMTRAEFAAIAVRALGLRLEEGKSLFMDVRSSDWYDRAIRTASQYGLINGFEDGSFRPDDKITREQAMTIVSKAMAVTKLPGKPGGQSASEAVRTFSDADTISNWALDGVADSVSAGIVAGTSSERLAPKAYVTRAEVAMMLQRLLQKSDLINK